MDEEKLQEIKEKYELSIIKQRQAIKLCKEAKAKLEADGIAFEKLKMAQSIAIKIANKNRVEYENAVYQFYEEYNE